MADISVDSNIHGGPLTGDLTADVTADVTSALTGLDAMSLTLGGGTTSTLAGGVTTTLAGENTVHTDSAVTLAPLTTTSSVDTTSSLDLKPVAVDSCVRLELAPPPATDVCTPYQQRWSWSILGTEVFSLAVEGSTTTSVRPSPSRPVVIDL